VAAFLGHLSQEVRPTASCANNRLVGQTSSWAHGDWTASSDANFPVTKWLASLRATRHCGMTGYCCWQLGSVGGQGGGWGTGAILTKTALAVRAALIVTLQLAVVPLHAPSQWSSSYSTAGVASSLTAAPGA
jgi:hypothetical protein